MQPATQVPATSRLGIGHELATAERLPRGAEPYSDGPSPQPLARYVDGSGDHREIVVGRGRCGSLLVVDRDLRTRTDRRLLAHLGADEPRANAVLVCQEYLRDCAAGPPRCRRVTGVDERSDPLTAYALAGDPGGAARQSLRPAGDGRRYALELVRGRMSIPELRWRRTLGGRVDRHGGAVSLREVVASFESYEPMCSRTEAALAGAREDPAVSVTVLQGELARVRESPIVLNRLLREAVLAVVARRGLSLSEIAMRCGRVKRDRRGNESGETSWLGRRLGLLPEGGQDTPTPWIHSDVLALIAREGLGISPREVELS